MYTTYIELCRFKPQYYDPQSTNWSKIVLLTPLASDMKLTAAAWVS